MKKIIGTRLIVGILIGVPFSLQAANFTVTEAANNANDTDCSDGICSLQAALDATQTNGESDIINIDTGTYPNGGNTFLLNLTENFPITIQGTGQNTTILESPSPQGNQRFPVLALKTLGLGDSSNADISISGMTLQKGSGGELGAGLILFTKNADVVVNDVRFLQNIVDGINAGSSVSGGGSFIFSSGSGNVSISGCKFEENRAENNNNNADTGIGGGLAVATTTGNLSLINNVFDHNSSDLAASGAAVQTESGVMSLTGNTFSNNSPFGGLDARVLSGSALISENQFLANTSDGPGGGMIGRAPQGQLFTGSFEISKNIFQNNLSNDPTVLVNGVRVGGGGGLFLQSDSGTVSIADNQFLTNTAKGPGGGFSGLSTSGNFTITGNKISQGNTADELATGLGSGGFLIQSDSGTVSIEGNLIEGNISNTNAGGANVNVKTGSSINLSGNTIKDNQAIIGKPVGNNPSGFVGGAFILAQSGQANAINNLIFNNSSLNLGGGLGLGADLSGVVTNNTIVNNDSATQGGGLAVATGSDSTAIGIFNNIIRGNSAPFAKDIFLVDDSDSNNSGSFVNITNSDFSDFVSLCATTAGCASHITQADNINTDPLFVNPANADFHLQAGSPCINTGDPNATKLPSTDIEGDPRPIPANGDPDMGADEFSACGDGFVNANANETCDDGNTTSGDGCDSLCHTEGGGGGGGGGSGGCSLIPQ